MNTTEVYGITEEFKTINMKYIINKACFFLFFAFICISIKTIKEKNRETRISYQLINFNDVTYDTINLVNYIINEKDYIFFKDPILEFHIDNQQNTHEAYSDTTYRYYIFNQKYALGFKIDSLNAKSYQVINKDSFFSKQMYAVFEKANSESKEDYSYLNSFKESGLTIAKYYLKREIDSSYCDTTLFYLDDNLRGTAFSLNKHIDLVYKSKCIRERSLYYNKIKSDSRYGTVYREYSISFTVNANSKTGELLKLETLFDKYNSVVNYGQPR